MMTAQETLPIYQIDAFTDEVFAGNPAAVAPLKEWLSDEAMQAIAMENNLSETAFFVPEGEGFRLRWFTPAAEVELCGHATLASAHLLFSELGYDKEAIAFETRSGRLTVERRSEGYAMDFPATAAQSHEPVPDLAEALGGAPQALLVGSYAMAVFETADEVAGLAPNFEAISKLDWWGVIATAPGDDYDFVSRFFAPAKSVPEDPVTGSAHCMAAPYWAERLGRNDLKARQISKRGGEVGCLVKGDRVELTGKAVLFLKGEIYLPKGV